MRRISLLTAILLLTGLPALAAGHPHDPPAHPHDPPPAEAHDPRPGPRVDVALLLDTSNSMDGLISQAKGQLWSIVQQFAEARKHGKAPRLRVALFEYGNTNLPATEGYIRQVVPLTSDLDKLSQALFVLRTQVGDEYCGQVIDECVKRLAWAPNDGAYKVIFIAGNEPFTQGEVDYRSAVTGAVDKGIVVNTIHCGDRSVGIAGMWQDGAVLGKGEFFNIDQDRELPHIPCPQDPILLRLNERLNDTYLWYGAAEVRGGYAQNQRVQDRNAAGVSEQAAAQRARVKAGSGYNNVGRDLVDTYQQDPEILAKLEESEFPEAMQSMTPAEREAHVKQMAEDREALQKEIAQVSAEREAYYQAQLKKQQGDGGKTLGEAVNAAVEQQLAEAGYEVEASPTTQPSESSGSE